MKIILLDDIPANREPVLLALKQAFGAGHTVQLFAAGAAGVREGTYESRITKDLLHAANAPIDLIVADRDLSGYTEHYNGLSEPTIRRVADALVIPEVGYARGEDEEGVEYLQQGEHREACIRLPLKPTLDAFAQRIVGIANGFQKIIEKVSQTAKAARKRSPGTLLAGILEKPEYSDKISLFSSGDQNRLSAFNSMLKTKDTKERDRRLGCLLGYWLWDSILRFPGVVVDGVAASSYLNIRAKDFAENPKIRGLFDKARYVGPFSDALDPLWWRGALDDVVSQGECPDGRTLAEKQLKQEIPRSECCEDPSKPAGYYCVLSKRPVSLENSLAGLPWFPRGADLARVSKKKHEEEVPWLSR